MFRSIALAFALVVGSSGCAVGAIDDEQAERDLVAESASALSGASTPKGVVTLYARATYDKKLGTTMVDVATSQIPILGNVPDQDPHATPHDQDEFVTVLVYVDRKGRRDVLRVLGRSQIGPGGGCIHFNIVARAGDELFIGGVVKIGGGSASVGLVPGPVLVQNGNWQDDPTVQEHVGSAP